MDRVHAEMRRVLKNVPGARRLVRMSRTMRSQVLLGPFWPMWRTRLASRPGMSLSKFVAAVLQAGDIACDVGANVGRTSLLMASGVGKSGLVCAFEPNPACFAELARSSKRSWHRNLRAYALALSDFDGPTTLLVDQRDTGVASTLIPAHARRETVWHKATYAPIMITATTLDAFCERVHLAPSFLKIDVEGGEEMVIRGGARIIAKHLPVIWFECWAGVENGIQINDHLGHLDQLGNLGYSFFIATIFKLDGSWVSEESVCNPRQLLRLEPQDIRKVRSIGCDIVAAAPHHLARLENLHLISSADAMSHMSQSRPRPG